MYYTQGRNHAVTTLVINPLNDLAADQIERIRNLGAHAYKCEKLTHKKWGTWKEDFRKAGNCLYLLLIR